MMCAVAVGGDCIFFFKQKTAYEMLRSLVGSEMCIRDSDRIRMMNAVQELIRELGEDRAGSALKEKLRALKLSLIHI